MAIHLTRIEELALVTLDRPEVLNALNFELLRDLAAALDQVAEGDGRALLVTGAGDRAFCAGADIKELMGRSLGAQRQGAAFGQAVFAKLDTLPIPSIALINGYAFGGGLELALACTFRLAARTARLGLPEIKLGLIPGYGGTQRLPRLIGEARALEIILTGRTVEAEEAERIGLVNRITEGRNELRPRDDGLQPPRPGVRPQRDPPRPRLRAEGRARDRSRPQHPRLPDGGRGRRHDGFPRKAQTSVPRSVSARR
jgi:enoyl-CoA hydratase